MDEDRLFDYIRWRLKAIRRKRALTAAYIASSAGMPRSTYSSIENGVSRPSVGSLHKVHSVLKIDISSVWPVFYKGSREGLIALTADNLFRFREIVLLTEAEAPA